MPSIIYNDDVEMYDPSYNAITDSASIISDGSTPNTNPTVQPITVTDNNTRSLDGWIKNTTATAGTAGESYSDTAPVEKNPLSYSTSTRREKSQFVIHDYTTSYLQDLDNQGYSFYVVYEDGTRDQVTYSEIYNPHQMQSSTYINEALDIANAINQNFWTDTNGVHVTDVSKDDWNDAVAAAFSGLSTNNQYHNILMNSLGVLLRSALNNLVSLSRSGMTIYDGTGNTISDILAIFGSTGASFREGGKTRVTVTSQGLTVYDNSGSVSNNQETYGNQVAFIGIDGSGKPYSRIGKSTKGYIDIGVNSNDNGYIDFYNSSTLLCHIGYDAGTNGGGGTSNAPYYNFGIRSSSTIGNYSFVEGVSNTASGYVAHAEGYKVKATGLYSHAEGYETTAGGHRSHAEGWGTKTIGDNSHAEGRNTTTGINAHAEGYSTSATGEDSHAEGAFTTAAAQYSHAEGYGSSAVSRYAHADGNYAYADTEAMHACGKYNRKSISSCLFAVGNGTSDSARSNAMTVLSTGAAYINGTSSSNGTSVTSDARIKTLHHVLDPEESSQFIQILTPKMYYKNGVKEMGFYAQDVEIIPTYGDILVTKDNSGLYDFPNFRLLDYQGLIAPIISALQHALNEIDMLKQEIEELKNN